MEAENKNKYVWPFDWHKEVAEFDPNTKNEPTFADICQVLEADNVQADTADFLLSLNGIGFCARGNVHALVSKRKQGKTFAGMAKAAALISGNFGEIVTKDGKQYKVLVFDTEQDGTDVKARKNAVIEAAGFAEGTKCDNLKFICARYAPEGGDFWGCKNVQEWRTKLLAYCVKTWRPDYVLLDGIRELVRDKNDQTEATKVREMLQQLAGKYLCAVECVCHENEKQGSETAIGAIGTELENMCDDFTQVSKHIDEVNDTTTIEIKPSALYSRHKAPKTWCVSVTDGWTFSWCTEHPEAEERAEQHRPSANDDFKHTCQVLTAEEQIKSVLTPEEAQNGVCLPVAVWRNRLAQSGIFAEYGNPRDKIARVLKNGKTFGILSETPDGLTYEGEI